MNDCKFIWGVKFFNDLCEEPAGLHMMNDIEIFYEEEAY